MSDAPNSTSKVQQEALQTAKPVSESLAFNLGGAINYCLTNAPKVGDVVYSDLSEAAFVGQRDATWVLSDGRSVVGSVYQTLTGLTNVPDRRGRFIRMKDNGAGVDTHGDLAIGAIEADQFTQHTHTEHYRIPDTAAGGSAGGGDTNRSLDDVFEQTGVASAGGGGTETHPKYSVSNVFVKINP